jgi:hypothetical protein
MKFQHCKLQKFNNFFFKISIESSEEIQSIWAQIFG